MSPYGNTIATAYPGNGFV